MFVVYAQRVALQSLVTYNKYVGVGGWRREMADDGFTVQRAINVLVDPINGNKVMILAECDEESKAADIAKLGNRAMQFAFTE
jgi:hypothetical protein